MFIKKYFDEDEIKDKGYLLINSFFALFPISFIFGNIFVELNLIIFCLLGIFYLKPKISEIKLNFSLKIILLFFIIIIISTSISFVKSLYIGDYEEVHLVRLIKSILLFRFFLLLTIIYFLNKYTFLNFKYFFLSAAFFTTIISLDIIFQYIFGFNTIGWKNQGSHNPGFFGNELIAGNFIQRFSYFSILFVAFAFKNKNTSNYFFITIIISILGIGILSSGNRMPLILFLLGLFLIFLFDVKLKKIITLSFITLFILLISIISSNERMEKNYFSYYQTSKTILMSALPNTLQKKIRNVYTTEEQFVEELLPAELENITLDTKGGYWETTEKGTVWKKLTHAPYFQTLHERLFLTAIDTWKLNKLFGNGIKSFRLDCQKLATTPPALTEEKRAKIKLLYEEGKLNEARHLLKKVLEKQIGAPGTSETVMAETFVRFKKNRLCSSHPHNYYLEILTETGVIGLASALSIVILFLAFLFKNFRFIKGITLEQNILLASIISLILEIFPLRTTGSIFTANNATFIILIGSILLCYEKISKINNYK